MLLGRCEFGKEDYSLNIINMPEEEPTNEKDKASAYEQKDMSVQELNVRYNKNKKKPEIPTLFDDLNQENN